VYLGWRIILKLHLGLDFEDVNRITDKSDEPSWSTRGNSVSANVKLYE
jgi:hypothetical protein